MHGWLELHLLPLFPPPPTFPLLISLTLTSLSIASLPFSIPHPVPPSPSSLFFSSLSIDSSPLNKNRKLTFRISYAAHFHAFLLSFARFRETREHEMRRVRRDRNRSGGIDWEGRGWEGRLNGLKYESSKGLGQRGRKRYSPRFVYSLTPIEVQLTKIA